MSDIAKAGIKRAIVRAGKLAEAEVQLVNAGCTILGNKPLADDPMKWEIVFKQPAWAAIGAIVPATPEEIQQALFPDNEHAGEANDGHR